MAIETPTSTNQTQALQLALRDRGTDTPALNTDAIGIQHIGRQLCQVNSDGTYQQIQLVPELPDGVTTIMCLGDSQTLGTGGDSPTLSTMEGIGGDATGGYREPLWNLLIGGGVITNSAAFYTGTQTATTSNLPSNQLKHEGHSGFTCANINTNFATYWGSAPAGMIILKIGVNDMNNGASAATAAASVGGCIANCAAIAGLSVPILYIAPFLGSAISAKPPAVVAAIPDGIAAQRNAGVRVRGINGTQFGAAADTLHQNYFGYRLEAGAIFKALTTLVF